MSTKPRVLAVLTGRDLVGKLARARADAKAGKPRPRFYIAVALALAAMASLILLRHLKG
jgi:hypothetical protein